MKVGNLMKFCRHFYIAGLLLYTAVFLFILPAFNVLAFDEQRIGEGLLVLLALIGILFNPPSSILSIQKVCIVGFILILMILSAYQAADTSHAVLLTSCYASLFYLAWLFSAIARQYSQQWCLVLFGLLLVAALSYQVNFFTGFLASFIENIPLNWPEPFSGFSNVRFFNQYQIWSLLLIPLAPLLYPDLKKRLLWIASGIAVGWAVLFFAAASRGAMLSVVLSLLLTAVVFKSHAKPFFRVNSITLLSGGIIYLLLFKALPMLLDNSVTQGWHSPETLADSSGRFDLWANAWRYIKENPWLGIGPMHYAYYPGPTHAHPHNSVLQWASEMGVPSTLLVLYLVYSGLRAWVVKFYKLFSLPRSCVGTLTPGVPTQERGNDENLPVSPHLWIGLFASLCAGLIYSLFSGVIVMPLSQLMMVLMIGWMLGIYYQDQAPKPVSPKYRIGQQLLAGVTLITLVYTALPDVLQRLNNEELLLQDYPVFAPRFWRIGGIPHSP